VSDYDEGYFDWHCRQSGLPPAQQLEWYTMCGTPFPNRVEYAAVVTFFCTLGWIVYCQLTCGSAGCHTTSVAPNKKKVT